MMGLALGSLPSSTASSRDESQASCLCCRLEELRLRPGVLLGAGDVRGRRVGEKQGHSGPGKETSCERRRCPLAPSLGASREPRPQREKRPGVGGRLLATRGGSSLPPAGARLDAAGKSDVEGRLPPPTSSPAPLSELRAAQTFCFEPTWHSEKSQ